MVWPHPTISGLVSLEWGLKFCISNTYSAMLFAVAGLETTVWDSSLVWIIRKHLGLLYGYPHSPTTLTQGHNCRMQPKTPFCEALMPSLLCLDLALTDLCPAALWGQTAISDKNLSASPSLLRQCSSVCHPSVLTSDLRIPPRQSILILTPPL